MTLRPGWFLVGRHVGVGATKLVYGAEHTPKVNWWHNGRMLIEVSLAKAIKGESVDGYQDEGFWWERQEVEATYDEMFPVDQEKG